MPLFNSLFHPGPTVSRRFLGFSQTSRSRSLVITWMDYVSLFQYCVKCWEKLSIAIPQGGDQIIAITFKRQIWTSGSSQSGRLHLWRGERQNRLTLLSQFSILSEFWAVSIADFALLVTALRQSPSDDPRDLCPPKHVRVCCCRARGFQSEIQEKSALIEMTDEKSKGSMPEIWIY
jgi:hypothetical protein